MGTAISIEGRIKHVQAVRAGHSNIFEGLDFWAPNINIFRDPRWGRGQETYGEDPFLTGRMGVAFVTGMQGDDPRYYRVISTPKHFAVHSGPEPTRHTANVDVSKHDEMDTYLPAFRAAVTEGKAGSVMCAYNSINGQPACANDFLLKDQLRGKWAFQGYVVSDCGAVIDIFAGHHYKPTQAQASAISLLTGMDNECADFFAKVTDDHDYKPYLDAVKQGYLKESDIDQAVTRLFAARIKLGMFDPPDMVPYSKIDESELDSAAHRALARKLANESMVLLKNDGMLPLKTSGIKIAVVGPLANQTKVLLGNYNGTPTHTVSVMEGLKAEFPSAEIKYVEGTQFLSKEASPVPPHLLSTGGKPGVHTTYTVMDVMALASPKSQPPPLASRTDPDIGVPSGPVPPEVAGKTSVVVQSEATLTPTRDRRLQPGHSRRKLLRCHARQQARHDELHEQRDRDHARPRAPGTRQRLHAESDIHAAAGRVRPRRGWCGPRSIRIHRPRLSLQRRMPMLSSRSSASPANLKAKRCRSARTASRAAIAPASICPSRKRRCSRQWPRRASRWWSC